MRLIGRPEPVDAAEVIRALLQELTQRIPTHKYYPVYLRALFRYKRTYAEHVGEFNDCLRALGKANERFLSAVRADRLCREHAWQAWRPPKSETISANELLALANIER